jgi:hypothetical protein
VEFTAKAPRGLLALFSGPIQWTVRSENAPTVQFQLDKSTFSSSAGATMNLSKFVHDETLMFRIVIDEGQVAHFVLSGNDCLPIGVVNGRFGGAILRFAKNSKVKGISVVEHIRP